MWRHGHDLFSLFRPSDPDPNTVYDNVDIYNATAGEWSRRSLSIPRQQLAAASLPDLGLAFFAGGRDASTGITFFLSQFHAPFSTRALCLPFMLSCSFSCTVGVAYDRLDIFNAYTKTWSVSSLSQARIYLAGASLPEQGLVLFAGGSGTVLRVSSTSISSVHAWQAPQRQVHHLTTSTCTTQPLGLGAARTSSAWRAPFSVEHL